jgi:hypothetical protein
MANDALPIVTRSPQKEALASGRSKRAAGKRLFRLLLAFRFYCEASSLQRAMRAMRTAPKATIAPTTLTNPEISRGDTLVAPKREKSAPSAATMWLVG